MYLATVYETDNGGLLSFQVAIPVKYNGKLQNQQIDDNLLIPAVLLSAMIWFARNPCPTRLISARYVMATLFSGDTLEIAYPFRPNTANWFTFWQQLQSPEIVSIQGFGEKMTDKLLRDSLNL